MKKISPLILFLCLYLLTSIVAQDFYAVPLSIAFLVSSLYALATMTESLNRRLEIFASGAANGNMMLMLLIFMLAGAFASSAKQMGAVDATVNLALDLLPHSFLLPGIFLAACFISLAVGSSVGTIAALTPVAIGIAQHSSFELPFVVAIVVGGAYFGDNLSFISDTTITATQSQGCKMSDKFRTNACVVVPVALLMVAYYWFVGSDVPMVQHDGDVSVLKVIPYLVVIATAVCGVNVIIVLLLGLVLSGVMGMALGCYSFFGWLKAMNDGVMGMGELIIVTLLAGGMLGVIKHNGGIELIIRFITRKVNSRRGGEYAIAFLTTLVNICTANNTVAIITVGPIARDISRRFGIEPRMSASILDTFSCFAQGLLPYGAQMLIAASLASISPVSIMQYLYYPLAIGIAMLLRITMSKEKTMEMESINL